MSQFTCVGDDHGMCPCSLEPDECACRTLDLGDVTDVLTCIDCAMRCERTCVGCGCTVSKACDGGCSWATPDLCSSCVDGPPDDVGSTYDPDVFNRIFGEE